VKNLSPQVKLPVYFFTAKHTKKKHRARRANWVVILNEVKNLNPQVKLSVYFFNRKAHKEKAQSREYNLMMSVESTSFPSV